MTKLALTDLAIKRFPHADGAPTYYWDTHMAGLGLRVSKQAKTFVVLVGSGERQTIGRHPTLTLAEARVEAKRILAEKTLGQRSAPSLTFDTVRDRFLAACREKNRPRTVSDYTRLLRHFPFKGKIGDVRRHHVVEKIEKIGRPSERSHALVAVKVLFRWAERHGYIEHNPCSALRAAPAGGGRERVLTDDELGAVLRRATESPWPYGPIVRLLILTGQRRGEIAALRWEWVDESERTITIPGSTTKNRRSTTIPYSDLTEALLGELPRFGDYLFPATRSHVRGQATTVFNGWGKLKSQFDRGLFTAPWTLHDLRRTFATHLAAAGVPIHVTEKLLNHVSGTISGVAAIYNRHAYMDEMRAAIVAWEEKLARLVVQGSPKRTV